MKSSNKIVFLNENSFYPIVYNNELTVTKIIKNLKFFFGLDFPNLDEKRLILCDNKEIQDFDSILNQENFNLLALDFNQIVKYRSLTILSQIFCNKFKFPNESVMFIPKSELENKENDDVYLYKNCVCKLTNFTESEQTKNLVDFFIKNKNNPSSLFQGIVLDDTEIPTDFEKNFVYGIPILSKRTKAIDLQSFIKNNSNISTEIKMDIIKEIFKILLIDDPNYIFLRMVNKFSLLFDESSKKIYFDINTLFSSNLMYESQAYPAPEVQIGTHSCVWSFGILIYFILHGEHVFKNQNNYENYIKNKSALIINGDTKIQTIIKKCLELDHTNRITLKDCYNHIEEYVKSLKSVAKSVTDNR